MSDDTARYFLADAQISAMRSEEQVDRLRSIAANLYTALKQMQTRRGVHFDDVDLVLDALEAYEALDPGNARGVK